jgi:hypothetical protein
VWVPFALIEDTSAFDIALGGRGIIYEFSVHPMLTFLHQPDFLVEILNKITRDMVIQHSITIPEGYNIYEIKDLFYLSPFFYFMVLLSFLSNEKAKYVWIIIFVVSYLLALGRYSPINLYLLINHIPFVNEVRFPFRYMYITILSGSILCGLGYQWAESKVALFLNHHLAKAKQVFFYIIFVYFYYCIYHSGLSL